jgi:hypothetical protein
MPMFRAMVNDLNRMFDGANVATTAKMAKAFAPGQKLDSTFLAKKNSSAAKLFQTYLDNLPGSMAETMRGVFHYALTSSPPIPITFAWAPAHVHELTIWEYDCGITMLFKSRFPKEDKLKKKG